jgi:RND family efflux transporter MFP subunit
MKTNLTYLLLLVAVVLLAGCEKKVAKKSEVISVRTVKASLAGNGVTKNYIGTIEEEEGVNVSFSVVGTVSRVMVHEGQFVSKGQALAESDGQNIRHSYEVSKVTLAQAEDAYRRLKNLYDKGTLPEIRMVEAESQLQRARSAEAISRKSLEDITLRAPWSGYIASCGFHEGANIVPGMGGIKLVKIDRVKLRIPIPEKEIGAIKTGESVSFTVSALGDKTFTGRVIARGLTANAISHAYDVRALVENGSHALLPGMVAKVRIHSKTHGYQLVIPQQAVLVSGQDKFVWLVKGGKAIRRSITTGDITNEGVVVESGLSNGETVIVEGQSKVCEGLTVKEI